MCRWIKNIVKKVIIVDNNIRYNNEILTQNQEQEDITIDEVSYLLVDILNDMDDRQEVFLEMIEDMMEDKNETDSSRNE